MNKENIKKVVLAYSGGLDTSVIIPWLKENYNNCEIIAVSGNVGQGDELEGLEEKALKTGASKLYVLDLTDEYVKRLRRKRGRTPLFMAAPVKATTRYALSWLSATLLRICLSLLPGVSGTSNPVRRRSIMPRHTMCL